MALHGVIVKKDGTVLPIVIGEDADDPVVGISDLLIHLSGKQMEKNAKEVVEGENLNVLVGSISAGRRGDRGSKSTDSFYIKGEVSGGGRGFHLR